MDVSSGSLRGTKEHTTFSALCFSTKSGLVLLSFQSVMCTLTSFPSMVVSDRSLWWSNEGEKHGEEYQSMRRAK